jgi:hypothetical protein
MKNTYSILERNRIVEEHLWCINSVMRKNHALIRAARLDYEEVYQQLALRLIRAVETFDPDKGVLRIHILAQLKYELLSCKTPCRLYGITYAPADFCGKEFISLDAPDLYRQDEALAAA